MGSLPVQIVQIGCARQVGYCDALNPLTFPFYWMLIQSQHVPLGADCCVPNGATG